MLIANGYLVYDSFQPTPSLAHLHTPLKPLQFGELLYLQPSYTVVTLQ